jgi:hypothetical protein
LATHGDFLMATDKPGAWGAEQQVNAVAQCGAPVADLGKAGREGSLSTPNRMIWARPYPMDH